MIVERSNVGHGKVLNFSEKALKEIAVIKDSYPKDQPRATIMPTLWVAQEEFAWISPEVMGLVAGVLDVPLVWVQEVATFYTMFNKTPVGKYHIQVCRNIACCLRGSENVSSYLEKKLGIEVGQTTSDKKFTLSEVECLGACGYAPMMQINKDYHEHLDFKKIDQVLETLK